MDQELYAQIQQEFQEGRLSEAFSLLIKAAEGQDRKIQDDILLLKSKFEYSRNQYEVKGILTDKEFNIQYSKSMIGAQDALTRLRNNDLKAAPIKQRKVWLLPVLLLMVLGIGGLIWYATSSPSEPVSQEKDQAVSSIITEPVATTTGPPPAESKPESKPDIKEEHKQPTNTPTVKKEDPPTDPVVETKTEIAQPPPPPAKTFSVTLIRNSDMSDAQILVDGQPAVILNDTPSIIIIQVKEKSEMHLFEMKKDGRTCKREKLITQDKQKVNFNCT